EVAPRRADDPARQAELDAIVAEAHFQLARSAQRAFDYERALAGYATLVGSARFARSADPEMPARLRDARWNAARLSSSLGRHAEAARAWEEAARMHDGEPARRARLQAAREQLAARDARGAARALDRWLAAHPEAPEAAEAHWLRARAAEAGGDEPRRLAALEATVDRVEATREPTPRARDRAARAQLALADAEVAARSATPIRVGRHPDLASAVDALEDGVRRETARVRAGVDAYEAVVPHGRALQSVAALTRQGALYEGLVRDVLDARLEMPRRMRARLRASPAIARRVRARWDDTVRGQLDARVRPVECLAVRRYLLAARLASRASLPSDDAQRAARRLAAYGEERVAACAAEGHAADPSFEALRPGELDRARRGRHAGPPATGATPPLADSW
ncbi:MAG TPA: hypothetical protein RMH99_22375, partial [Sandaracinaceae bacterium LLY-WYZ-13_1]|nr:hypothetical protein [Sandaracinaceae bacterium LLY-WYZ-13_1]